MWNYSKEDLHKLLEENSYMIEDSEALHHVPVNYYLLGHRKGEVCPMVLVLRSGAHWEGSPTGPYPREDRVPLLRK